VGILAETPTKNTAKVRTFCNFHEKSIWLWNGSEISYFSRPSLHASSLRTCYSSFGVILWAVLSFRCQ